MEILIADDDPMSQTLVAALVRKLGHNVVLVGNGEEAVHAFETQAPDLVLMDGQMPVMDGFAATRRIREVAARRWTPILFIAAENETDTIVRALDAGADDYLTKPVHPAMLRAKLAAVARVHKLYTEGEAQKQRLQNYHDAAEHEGRIALHLMQKLVNAEQLDDPLLKTLSVPLTANFSGDLVAAARTPRGALHVMLADAVGHGLAAALNVLPIVPCFYSMTAKGFDLDSIAVELNRTLRQYMPIDRFVATTLISVDPAARRIKVWNGANPPVLAFAEDGAVIARFPAKNMALGIVPEAAFDPVVDVFEYAGDCQLFACSDGVVEDYGATGSELTRSLRVERMLVECPLQAVGSMPALSRMPAHWHFEVSFGAADLREIDVVSLLLEVIETVPGAHFHRRQLGVIVSELFANALDHGVLGLPSGMKDDARGFERFYEARAEALARLEQGSISVHVEACWRNGRPQIELQLRDSGSGFVAPAAGRVTGLARHGRGIMLVKSLCRQVEYHGAGNDVRAVYVFDDAGADVLRAVA